ncbi:MAG: hypothetical protein K1X89_06155 [Myxococcaceae bacterium]|nr:hypothetical protein [Myxococcaceae bacterium]
MFRWPLMLALLSLPAVADPQGFSSDGRYWVTTETLSGTLGQVDENTGAQEGPFWSASLAVVNDLLTGKAERYALSLKGDDKKATAKAQDAVKGLPDAAAYEGWKKEHPLTLHLSRTSPDGKRTAEISVKPSDEVSWKQGTFTFERMFSDDGCRSLLTFSVVTDGKAQPVQTWWGEGPSAGMLSGTVKPAWSPDGRRVAWVIHRNMGMVRDTAMDLVKLSATSGPRVEVLADKSIAEQAVPKVTEALGLKGTFVANVGPAKKARDASVVYAAKGFEAQAKELAALVPGGATVEPLTWKTESELVIAAGRSVLKP